MQNKKLTIAIPTYNRVDKLKRCIEHLMKQPGIEDIEIYVSDNASSDGTKAYMEQVAKENSIITYHRNEVNIGPDANFLNCYEKGQGEYVYLLSDDDILMPNALESILKAIEEEPVFIYLNSSSILDEEKLAISAPRCEEGESVIYTDKDAFFKDVGVFITFVSALIMKKSYLDQIENKTQYIGSYFLQSYLALETIANNGKYIYIKKNCIAASMNDTVGYDLYFVWIKSFHDLIVKSSVKSGVTPQVAIDIYRHELKTMVEDFVITFRVRCANEKEWNKKYVLDTLKPYPDLWWRFAFLIHVPIVGLKVINLLKHGPNNVEEKIEGTL